MTAVEGIFPTCEPTWTPVIMKFTEEIDSQPFAKADAPRTVKTTRIWYMNSQYPDVLKVIGKVPET